MHRFLSVTVLFLAVVLAAGVGAAEAIALDWPGVMALMRAKGIVRGDLPSAVLKAYDRVASAVPSDRSVERQGALAELGGWVQGAVIDAAFVAAKKDRLQGQVRLVLATRAGAEGERDRITGLLDRALTLITQDDSPGANVVLNEVDAWVESYRHKPKQEMPASCRDPEPPAECRAWLSPKQPGAAGE